MKTETAYCSGCARKVRLVFTDPPPHDGQANLPEGEGIVCLDYRESCSGERCPNTGKPGIVMGVRLAKSHLNDEAFKTIHGRCEACGEISDLEVLDEHFALCPLCNTTNRWVVLKRADGSEVAVVGG